MKKSEARQVFEEMQPKINQVVDALCVTLAEQNSIAMEVRRQEQGDVQATRITMQPAKEGQPMKMVGFCMALALVLDGVTEAMMHLDIVRSESPEDAMRAIDGTKDMIRSLTIRNALAAMERAQNGSVMQLSPDDPDRERKEAQFDAENAARLKEKTGADISMAKH